MPTIKRNNPGNIRPAPQKWQGEITPPGSPFCHFSTLTLGSRAMLKLLRNYIVRHKRDTIPKIINRWAPPSENNTSAYISYVANRLHVTPDTPLKPDKETLIALAAAMAHIEHGTEPHQAIWHQAYDLL